MTVFCKFAHKITGMDIEQFRDYCLALGEVTEKTPFGKFNARFDSILAFYVCGHMFCFVDIDDFSWVNLKAAPATVEELRDSREAALPPMNMSPRHWVQIRFDMDISDDEIRKLVKEACAIVASKYSPKGS